MVADRVFSTAQQQRRPTPSWCRLPGAVTKHLVGRPRTTRCHADVHKRTLSNSDQGEVLVFRVSLSRPQGNFLNFIGADWTGAEGFEISPP